MMRHIRVPTKSVESTLEILKKFGWLNRRMRIISSEAENFRLIPLDSNAPIHLPPELSSFEIIEDEGLLENRMNTDWLDYLLEQINESEFEEYRDYWPNSHEFIGDMMVVRIDEAISKFTEKIAIAKLKSHQHIRLILNDNGVKGEYRIRDLAPIGHRKGKNIHTKNLESKINTKVIVKESGQEIICDPTKAYFSTKLQTERLETLSLAKELKIILKRPISICDPFCGVGPALAPLLREENLVDSLLACDFNPNAVNFLFENLTKWDKRKYPNFPKGISKVYQDRIIGHADATKLAQDPELLGIWDLLILNIPHRALEFLPKLTPLLRKDSPTLIRGRIIVPESEILSTNKRLNKILPNKLYGFDKPSLKVKRDYSSSLRLCSFHAWLKISNQ